MTPRAFQTHLADVVAQMGAVHKLDLTSDVTHLIVGDSNTPKYKYVAKERPDMKVLAPDWVEAVRQSWMQGDDTDVQALEDEYRLPTLAGLKICVTGFDNRGFPLRMEIRPDIDNCYAVVEERQALQEAISGNGASYHGDLTKDVTHLIAVSASGRKYQYGTEWGVRIVTLSWLKDSLERGMILDEPLYHPLLPEEERGKNAWVKKAFSSSTLRKRAREEDRTTESLIGGKRKLRRTASLKLGSQNEGLWNDIIGGGFGLGEELIKQSSSREWNDSRVTAAILPKNGERDQTPDVSTSIAPTKAQGQEPLSLELARDGIRGEHTNGGLFRNKCFYLHGFEEKKVRHEIKNKAMISRKGINWVHRQASIIQDHLLCYEGEVFYSISQLSQSIQAEPGRVGYLLVPHHFKGQLPATKQSSPPLLVVTEWWLERCLFKKQLMDPENDALSTLFREYPLAGFENLVISSTSFSGIDLLQVSKVVKLLGGTYDEYLTPETSVLVCNSSGNSKEKLKHALEWNVTAVSADWLWDCIRSRHIQDFESYLVAGGGQTPKAWSAPVERPRKSSLNLKSGPGDAFSSLPEPRQRPKENAASHPKKPFGGTLKLKPGQKVPPLVVLDETPPPASPPASADGNEAASDFDALTVIQPLNKNEADSNSRPLTDISPDVNSQKRPSASPTASRSKRTPQPDDSIPTSNPVPNHPPQSDPKRPPEPVQEDLSTTIAALLAHKQASAAQSRAAASSNSADTRRKRRLLGRAPSNLSTTSRSFSRASSADTAASAELSGHHPQAHLLQSNLNSNMSFHTDDPEDDDMRRKREEDEQLDYMPSQAVLYEDPEVQKERDRMLEKMGGGVVHPVDNTEDDVAGDGNASKGSRRRRIAHKIKGVVGVVRDVRAENNMSGSAGSSTNAAGGGGGRVTRARRVPGF
ncbi:MAG: hypothetical protein M1819_000387 [Sarea resinae]|nr:MAG: hypothetical protein M1819_000387 [Sarea resinae]